MYAAWPPHNKSDKKSDRDMKFSRIVFLSFFLFCTANFTSSLNAQAGTLPGNYTSHSLHNSDPELQEINKPNLDKSDGFDESEHKRKIQEKPAKKQPPVAEIIPQKHNL